MDGDREHLSQYGDTTSRKYPPLQDITNARLNAGDKLRFGIWGSNDEFVGSINATPSDGGTKVEVGYWLRSGAQGHGYATFAVKALTDYLRPHYRRVFA